MSEKKEFPTPKARGKRMCEETRWHDLVAAVVALNGARPVSPSASTYVAIERNLGLSLRRSGAWRRYSIWLGGFAAAAAVGLGLIVLRDGAPPKAAIASSAGPAVRESLPFPAPSQGASRLASKSSGGMAAGAGATASQSTDKVGPGAGLVSTAKETARENPASTTGGVFARIADARAGSSSGAFRLRVGAGGAGKTSAAGDMIELKNDYYVAGLISAAMQSPPSANPFEPAVQPDEWSDWVSGYELGSVLPSAEALALGATWSWSDPDNLALVAGSSGETASTAAATLAPPESAAVSRVADEQNQSQGGSEPSSASTPTVK